MASSMIRICRLYGLISIAVFRLVNLALKFEQLASTSVYVTKIIWYQPKLRVKPNYRIVPYFIINMQQFSIAWWRHTLKLLLSSIFRTKRFSRKRWHLKSWSVNIHPWMVLVTSLFTDLASAQFFFCRNYLFSSREKIENEVWFWKKHENRKKKGEGVSITTPASPILQPLSDYDFLVWSDPGQERCQCKLLQKSIRQILICFFRFGLCDQVTYLRSSKLFDFRHSLPIGRYQTL